MDGDSKKSDHAIKVLHDLDRCEFYVVHNGVRAHVKYAVDNDRNTFDIRHTVVPEAIGGMGIASALVKTAYDYAGSKGMKPLATCSYAAVWLKRHPEYNGELSDDYCDGESCGM